MYREIQIPETNRLVELTAGVVAAYVQKHVVPATELANLIAGVHTALGNTAAPPVAQGAVDEKLRPAVSIRKSITHDHIICLEDGRKFKSLKRHLGSLYNMTPEEYREKWGLPDDYPMVAPSYAEKRSQLARASGLGQVRLKNK
ncbi:MucR family transcriptional regulator [Pararhizobium sp. YC-54]|uniref:MucR family transcriptional regulator n=1 Tax=Pararhizobium sp. YC-54 TaxID=2986920 RepID=UPI0021F7813D|nr:MucR family transcriptional regulator [Pararhizobium sp. YC-54]MCV9999535.1 MucR family transcriptional regulator [Pararhizobium sp. YC-54]